MEAESVSANHPTGVLDRLLPAAGPGLLIAVGYIDPGKWAASVEGGARFGYELVAPMLVFNFAAILCQYLSARIGVVTGRDLAQICSDEYDKFTCMFLGIQTAVSVIALDLTMILGIAYGLNLLFGVDFSICVFVAAVDAILFPLFATLQEQCKGSFLCTCIAGFMLLFYFLGVLSSQPEIPLSMNGMLTKLSGESAFALMSLLGANIMPHNFFLHSSVVLQRQASSRVSRGTSCLNHFVTILCIFSGIYLVNFVIMNSSANVFYSTGLVLLTFPDAMSIMEQVFRSPLAPFAVLLILWLANQLTALTWNLGGQAIVHDFLRLDIPNWLQRAAIRIIAIIPPLCCAWTSGLEGVYQLLIFTQVMVALLLPSSVIPLFRVAASRPIMGVYRMSQFLEFLAVITFLGMLGLKIMFVVEMIYGDSDWVGNLRWNMGSSSSIPYILLLLMACFSFVLMLWLAATPLKSATRPDVQIWNWDTQKAVDKPSMQTREDILNETKYTGEEHVQKQEHLTEPANSGESHSDITVENADPDLPETIMPSDQELRLTTIEENHSDITSSSSPTSYQQDLSSAKGPVSVSGVLNLVDDSDLLDSEAVKIELDPVEKTLGIEGDLHTDKDDDEVDGWELDESSKGVPGSTSSLTSDGPGSFKSLSGRNDDGGNGAGSLSRLAGLGRAARGQLAAVLDEFWLQMYDYHGQITPDAKIRKLGVLRADSKCAPSSQSTDTMGTEFNGYFSSIGGKGSNSLINTSLFDTPKQLRMQSTIDSSYGVQRGSSSMCSNRMQLLDAYVQGSSRNHDSTEKRYSNVCTLPYSDIHSSSRNVLDSTERQYSSVRTLATSDTQGSGCIVGDSTERRYSSVRTLPASNGWGNQPATIHGYEIASIVNRIAKDRNSSGLNGQMESPAPISPSFGPRNYGDPLTAALGQKVLNGLNTPRASGFHNLSVSRSALQTEKLYQDVCSAGCVDNSGMTINAKNYCSLPDISGSSGPYRGIYTPEKRTQWDNSGGFGSVVGRTSCVPTFYSTTGLGTGRPLAFDDLSKGYGDTFAFGSPSEPGSLWSKQPYEQFGVADKGRAVGSVMGSLSNSITREVTSTLDSEAQLLQSFRCCVVKLLKLEGSDWLFRQYDGADEDLIDRVAARERYLYEAETREINRVVHMGEAQCLYPVRKSGLAVKNDEAGITNVLVSSVPNCGDGCVWRVDLIVSFGVWCIHRILDLSLMERRPDLWGKYTYVLNRLQGIIEIAFSKPRSPVPPCFCLQIPATHQQRSSPPLANGMLPPAAKPGRGKCTTAPMLLDLINDVEIAISCRKGKSGTAAGDVAFPKGKANLASVLKRYKRRLSNKPVGSK